MIIIAVYFFRREMWARKQLKLKLNNRLQDTIFKRGRIVRNRIIVNDFEFKAMNGIDNETELNLTVNDE